MNFELPEELRLLRESAARFTARELIPHEPLVIRRDAERGYFDMPLLPPELEKQIMDKARAAGLAGLEVPEAHGGGGGEHPRQVRGGRAIKAQHPVPLRLRAEFPRCVHLAGVVQGRADR